MSAVLGQVQRIEQLFDQAVKVLTISAARRLHLRKSAAWSSAFPPHRRREVWGASCFLAPTAGTDDQVVGIAETSVNRRTALQ